MTRPILILFLIYLFGFTGAVSLCGHGCSCTSELTRCSNIPLDRLNQLPETFHLELRGTDLSNVSRFADVIPAHTAANLKTLHLISNRVVRLSSDAFADLPQLHTLHIESNPIECDCLTHQLFKHLQSKHVYPKISCAKPPNFVITALNVHHLNAVCGDIRSFVNADGGTMFTCYSGDGSTDEFEIFDDDSDDSDEYTDIRGEKAADGLFGNHECIFDKMPKGFTDSNVKMVVTHEANANYQNSISGEFNAELRGFGRGTNALHEDVHITCTKSGKFFCKSEEMSRRPILLTQPTDLEAIEGTTIELPCSAKNDVQVEILWKKDGSSVVKTARHRVASSGSLAIKKITLADAGRYECTARNEFGRSSAAALITVKAREYATSNEAVRVAFADASREVDAAINQTIAYLFSPNPQRPKHHGDLFKMIRYPNGNARELARAAEIYERTLVTLRKRVNAGASLMTEAEDFSYNDILSTEHLELIEQLSGCNAHRLKPNCTQNMCFHLKYRSIDGTCNNLMNTHWGASYTGFRRLLRPFYENGLSTPIGWDRERLYNGFKKPSARLISTEMISTKRITPDAQITHMVMQWGQFLDHDLDHALPSVSSESWDGTDCKKTCENTAPCYPIQVPPNDPRVKNRRCIDLFRSSSVCGSGISSILFNTVQPREQINQLTSYIDASQVYGFSYEFSRDLRNFTTDDGLLRTGISFPNQKVMLPFAAPTDGIDCRRDVEESKMNCFAAGDIRVNEQIGLTAMHTIWMREHNRIAQQLREINSHWDGETLYQETRKIVGAQMQLITYEHWLPNVLGEKGMEILGPYTGYDPNVDPSVSNEFATAALRFGHTLINPILHRLNESFQPIVQGHLELHRAFFAPWRLVYEGGVDPLMRGMFDTPAKLKKPSENLNTELTEKLFHTAHAVALDLAAINIQRGREHGIPGYNEYRVKCNLTEAKSFDDFVEISDANVRDKLKHLYGHPSNVDLFVGGILEDQVDGAKIGPTFRCILIDQFKRLRSGDRLWYENPSTFTPAQLTQIKMGSLARVLCDNGDNITQITSNIFRLPETQGGYKSCELISKINLHVWRNCEKCSASRHDPNTFYVAPTRPSSRHRRSADVSPDNQSELETRVQQLEKELELLKRKYLS